MVHMTDYDTNRGAVIGNKMLLEVDSKLDSGIFKKIQEGLDKLDLIRYLHGDLRQKVTCLRYLMYRNHVLTI